MHSSEFERIFEEQIINDAHELSFYYDDFWKLRDNVVKKASPTKNVPACPSEERSRLPI